MKAKIAEIRYYNERRYGWPWACRVVDGKNEFLRGAYDGNEDGGTVYIEDPAEGEVYGVGQRDNRGGNSVAIYMVWTGTAFVFCNRTGNPVGEDHYINDLSRNWNVRPVTDAQIEAGGENEMDIKGHAQAADNYERCIESGLSSQIMLDRGTGEVWSTERASENDWTEYDDEAIADITYEALEVRNAYWRRGEDAPALAEAVLEAAARAVDAYKAVTA